MGRPDQDGHWSFLMVCDEKTMISLAEEFRAEGLYSRNYSENWAGILEKLDDYPWTRLYPLDPFHDQFKERASGRQSWQGRTRPGASSGGPSIVEN